MFKFLKEKLKGVLGKISKKVEEEAPEEVKEVITEKKIKKKEKRPKEKKKKERIEEKKEERIEEVKIEVEEKKIEEKEPEVKKKGFFARIFKKEKKEEKPEEVIEEKGVKKEIAEEKPPEEKVEEVKDEVLVEEPEKKGFFSRIKERIVTKKISNDKFEELFSDLEIILLENNVALEVVDKIKEDLKNKLVDKPIKRGEVLDTIRLNLKTSIEDLLSIESIDVIKRIKEKKDRPYVILFVGINGSGKTTTLAKIANLCLKNKLSVVLGAGDCFRKGSIEQLEEWGKRLGVKVIKHQYGSDSAAVCWDTVAFAKSHNIDVVLLDTAGRQHSNVNLMMEMEKIVRVAKPDLKIFVGESLSGNDCTLQAEEFNKVVDFDGIILTKADVDEKGGAMISVSYVTHKPIIYLGLGQELSDIKEFDKDIIIKNLGL